MQTDFKTYSTQVVLGQVADSSLKQIDSFAAEADIKFGIAVMRGTNKDKQVLPSDGKQFLGITLRDDIQRKDFYPAKSMTSVMTKGRVIVMTTEAVSAGDIAYLHANGIFNKTEEQEGQKGLAIGIFVSSQELENNLVILEIK